MQTSESAIFSDVARETTSEDRPTPCMGTAQEVDEEAPKPLENVSFFPGAMAGIDTSQGKLMFPPRFIPYLEKHRIFELFHELTELLIQERPKDHVKFLRSVLPCAANRRDKPRVVFLGPPSFDRVTFAKELQRILAIPCITRFDLEIQARADRLRKLEKQISVAEEEYSCVCPGEYDVGEYESPFRSYRPPAYFEGESESEKRSSPDPAPVSAEEEEEEQVEEEEDPCRGMRVCPCKDGQVGEAGERIASAGNTKMEKFDSETENTSASGTREKLAAESRPITRYDGLQNETKDSSELTSCVCESSEETFVDYGVLGRCNYSEKGWVLVDFPLNAEEAEYLSEQGALPTHAILVHIGKEEENDREYKYLSQNWATVYRNLPVTDINLNGRSIPQLAESVGKLLRSMPHRHAPMLPRIALIGSRGSGARTQAKLLSKKYKIVHVDFQEEIARVLLRDDKHGDTYKRQLLTGPDPELEAALLEVKIHVLSIGTGGAWPVRILLSPKYQKRGWVITGFPTNIDQLRMFDLIATPPNRIIFIEVPARECFIRLYYRQTDWMNGKEYTFPGIVPEGMAVRDAARPGPEVRDRLMAHPKNNKELIVRDIEGYFEEKDAMMKYCGKTAAYVNGNKCVQSVFEQIDHVLINPSPAEPPRNPLAVGHGIREAYQRLQGVRMENGFTANNLLKNPPDPIFKL